MDTVEVKVQETGAAVVHTGKITKGVAGRPQRAVPYAPKLAATWVEPHRNMAAWSGDS